MEATEKLFFISAVEFDRRNGGTSMHVPTLMAINLPFLCVQYFSFYRFSLDTF
jgi:hypothetical protein